MTITGLDFVSLQVRDLEASAAFYENVVGLTRAAFSPPHAVVFDTKPIAFALRDLVAGVDLDATPQPGLGAALWFHDPEAATLHNTLVAAGTPITTPPFDGPFGLTFTFTDPDGYALTIHDRA